MFAVNYRAYSVAILLWQTAQRLARATPNYLESLMSMIFPPHSPLDSSPLFLLCYNDTCSFTWTGDEHINQVWSFFCNSCPAVTLSEPLFFQDIFECRTCGLVGTLCCCTECANVCHKNHDCKLKKTSPTAYCDCWEKCKCKALLSGNQTARYELFCRLMTETDLATKVNRRYKSILIIFEIH